MARPRTGASPCAALGLACCLSLTALEARAEGPACTEGIVGDVNEGAQSLMLIQMAHGRLLHSAEVSDRLRIVFACVVYAGLVIAGFAFNRKAGITALWFAIAGIYYACAGVEFLTGLYASVQIVTTVGYGDIVPTTALGKLGMIFIVLFGLVLIAGFLSELVDGVVEHELRMARSALETVEQRILLAGNADAQPAGKTLPHVPLYVMAFIFFLVNVLAGTTFFATVEACSCGFGKARIQGCVEEHCSSTGGIIKTPLDAAYFVVVTTSTVGFGDYIADSRPGQIFSIFWISLGVASLGCFVTSVTQFLQRRKRNMVMKENLETAVNNFCRDGKSELSKLDFLELQLKANGLVDSRVIEDILRHFDLIDRSKHGVIALAEVKAFCHPHLESKQ